MAGARTDLKTTALGVSEAILAIPDIVTSPSPSSVKSLAARLGSLPIEKLIDVYRRRKIRLLLKAKRSFLKSHDSTAKLASILGVPEDIVRRSRFQTRPTLTPRYAAMNPEFAAEWYGSTTDKRLTPTGPDAAQPASQPDPQRPSAAAGPVISNVGQTTKSRGNS